MKFENTYTIIMILALLVVAGCSNNSKSSILDSAVVDTDKNPNKVIVYFFFGEGCPHCSAEKPYLQEWAEKYPEIEVKYFETWSNKENAALFQEVAGIYGIQARGVPTTFIGEKNWVGFSSSMAPEIENYIKDCVENGCESPLDDFEQRLN